MSLVNKIKVAILAVVLVGVGVCGMTTQSVMAREVDTVTGSSGGGSSSSYSSDGSWREGMDLFKSGNETDNLDGTVKKIINTVLYVVGILAVVMVIIGGVKYTTSGGDSGAVTSAKNTILYGIIGLVIAILAYAIVNFVVDKLG